MCKTSKLKMYIGLLRPKTLFSGLSTIIVPTAYAYVKSETVSCTLVVLLIAVAVLAQIASNIANDLIDFKRGVDTLERKGPTRPLSLGLITEREVRIALAICLGLLLCAGISLLALSSWGLLIVALLVVLGIFAYSGGPYPLSHHGLGEVAVLIFFGWIPVITSYYILSGGVYTDPILYCLATSLGLASINILVVNNYRDCDEDRRASKRTLIVRMGKDFAPRLYLSSALLSVLLLFPIYSRWSMWLIPVYGYFLLQGYNSLIHSEGKALNKTLALTARNVFFLAIFIALSLYLKYA